VVAAARLHRIGVGEVVVVVDVLAASTVPFTERDGGSAHDDLGGDGAVDVRVHDAQR